MDSRPSSERRLWHMFALGAVLAFGATACVSVKPHQKELLADPAMIYGSGGEAELQEDHILTNREGSAGAREGSGGGCGCN